MKFIVQPVGTNEWVLYCKGAIYKKNDSLLGNTLVAMNKAPNMV